MRSYLKKKKRVRLQLEELENRLVPTASLLNPQTVIWTDVDGDSCSAQISKGSFALDDFTFVSSGLGQQLEEIDLTQSDVVGVAGANLVINATQVPPVGDGLVNVGYINATGIDLNVVVVSGDLGRIDVGDSNTATPGLVELAVNSLGRMDVSTQAPGGNLVSNILGPLDVLAVNSDVVGAHISVTAGDTPVNGTIGMVSIGGSLIGGSLGNSGEIICSGNMGPVKIGGNIQGGAGPESGAIYAGVGSISGAGTMSSVVVSGSLLGGSGSNSGEIGNPAATGFVGTVIIGHNVQGGSGTVSGAIVAQGTLTSVTVSGSLQGGGGDNSGDILAAAIGPVVIGGNVQGGTFANSGIIQSGTTLALNSSVVVYGSLLGGTAADTGQILSGGDMGFVIIVGNIQGGAGNDSAEINSDGTLAQLFVGGSISATGSASYNLTDGAGPGQVVALGNIGPVQVNGGLVANGSGSNQASIQSGGAVGSVNVGGSLVAGGGSDSGSIIAYRPGREQHVVIHGSLIGGTAADSALILSSGAMGYVIIAGNVQGGTGNDSAEIYSGGALAHCSWAARSAPWARPATTPTPWRVRSPPPAASARSRSTAASSPTAAGNMRLPSSATRRWAPFDRRQHPGRHRRLLGLDFRHHQPGQRGRGRLAHRRHAGRKRRDLQRRHAGAGHYRSRRGGGCRQQRGHNRSRLPCQRERGGSLIGGGSFNSGAIYGAEGTGAVTIGGNIQGGAGVDSGFVGATTSGNVSSVTVGGSLLGGGGSNSGEITSTAGAIGTVVIDQDIYGGLDVGNPSGAIVSGSSIGFVAVGGSIFASTAGGADSRAISAHNNIDTIQIFGSLVGNAPTLSRSRPAARPFKAPPPTSPCKH